MISIAVLTEFEQVDALQREWSNTVAAGASDIFTSFAWCRAAWRNFPENGKPYVIAVLSEDRLLALLPLARRSGNLSWAGSPLGDEHDVRIRPNTSVDQVLPLIREALAHRDLQRLSDVRAGSSLVRIADGYPGCPSPVLYPNRPDTEFGALSCLPGLSRRRRKNLRRARNGLHRLGNVQFERLTKPEQLASSLPGFVAERITSWRQRGRLSELPDMDCHPAFTDFLTEVAYALAMEERCFLARLCVNGDPIAQHLFFRSPNADLMYMTTYRVEFARFSPSHLLLAEVAQKAVEEGMHVIETGRGDEGYKFGLGAELHHLRELEFSQIT